MSFVTLFNDNKSFLASTQKTYSAEDLNHVKTVIEQMNALSKRHEAMDIELKQLREDAKKEGYDAGYALGLADARNKSLEQITTLNEGYGAMIEDQKMAITDLALAVVKQIAGNVAPEIWLLAQARTAISRLTDNTTTVSLHVSPVQLEAVKRELEVLLRDNDVEAKKITELVVGEELSEEECQLHTPFGVIDVDLNTQLKSVAKVLQSPQTLQIS